MKKTIFISVFLLFLFGCKKQCNNTTKTIILEAHYMNLAWGYQHSVSLIDTNGIIRRYDNTNYDNEPWKFADSLGYISESDLQHNYNLCDSIAGTINKDTIRQCVSLISGVSTNNLSAITNEGADGGEIGYYCYIWDENIHKYRRLFLAQCGDWKQLNNNANAQTILQLIWKNSNILFSCF